MQTSHGQKNAGRTWLVLALLLTCSLLVGFWFLLAPGAEDPSSGLQPEVASQEDFAERDVSTLRDVSFESTRFVHEDPERVEEVPLAPVDWSGVELRAWRGVVLSTLRATPLADSLVEFRCTQGLVQAQTDADGQFIMQVPAGISGGLTASHPGYLARSRPNVRTGSQVSMLLVPTATIAGTYDGDPTGLVAELFASDSGIELDPTLSTPLDEEGRFRFEGLAPGVYSLRAAPGVYAILKNVPVEAGEVRQVELVAIDSFQQVEGRVVLKPGGQPIANAEVFVGYNSVGIPKILERGTSKQVLTDDDGRFEISLGEGARTSVRAVAPWGGEKYLGSMDAEAWLSKGEVLIEIMASAQLSGHLVDQEGEPVQGVVLELKKANVQKKRARSSDFSRLVTTDKDGAFDFGEVPARENLIVCTSKQESIDAGPVPGVVLGTVKLGPGKVRKNLRLRLGLERRLSGRVLDREEEPYGGVLLTVRNFSGDEITSSISDPLGHYGLEHLPANPGSALSIELSLHGHLLHRETLKAVSPSKGVPRELPATKDFHVSRKVPVAGWVLDDEGYGVGGVRVYLVQNKGRRNALGDGVSEADGAFRFLVSKPQEGKLEVALRSRAWQLPKGLSRELPNPLPDPLILNVERAPLEARAQVRGEVLVEGSATAVQRLRIQNSRGGTLVTEGSRFFLRGITPGRLRLKLKANGMHTLQLPAVDLVPGMDLDLGLIRMHRGCDLTLEITGTNGAKLPKGSKVRLRSQSKYEWDPDWKPRTLNLAKSVKRARRKPIRITQQGIARGQWMLQVEVPGFKKVSRKVDLRKRKANIKVKLVRK